MKPSTTEIIIYILCIFGAFYAIDYYHVKDLTDGYQKGYHDGQASVIRFNVENHPMKMTGNVDIEPSLPASIKLK